MTRIILYKVNHTNLLGDCGIPMDINRAIIKYVENGKLSTEPGEDSTLEGNEIYYTCGSEYETRGAINKSVCKSDGQWSSVDLMCRSE